jgi:hypothetical protein
MKSFALQRGGALEVDQSPGMSIFIEFDSA